MEHWQKVNVTKSNVTGDEHSWIFRTPNVGLFPFNFYSSLKRRPRETETTTKKFAKRPKRYNTLPIRPHEQRFEKRNLGKRLSRCRILVVASNSLCKTHTWPVISKPTKEMPNKINGVLLFFSIKTLSIHFHTVQHTPVQKCVQLAFRTQPTLKMEKKMTKRHVWFFKSTHNQRTPRKTTWFEERQEKKRKTKELHKTIKTRKVRRVPTIWSKSNIRTPLTSDVPQAGNCNKSHRNFRNAICTTSKWSFHETQTKENFFAPHLWVFFKSFSLITLKTEKENRPDKKPPLPAAARSMSRNSKPLERRLSANLRCCALKRDPRFPNTSTTPGIVNPEPCVAFCCQLCRGWLGSGSSSAGGGERDNSAQEGTANPAFSTNSFVFFFLEGKNEAQEYRHAITKYRRCQFKPSVEEIRLNVERLGQVPIHATRFRRSSKEEANAREVTGEQWPPPSLFQQPGIWQVPWPDSDEAPRFFRPRAPPPTPPNAPSCGAVNEFWVGPFFPTSGCLHGPWLLRVDWGIFMSRLTTDQCALCVGALRQRQHRQSDRRRDGRTHRNAGLTQEWCQWPTALRHIVEGPQQESLSDGCRGRDLPDPCPSPEHSFWHGHLQMRTEATSTHSCPVHTLVLPLLTWILACWNNSCWITACSFPTWSSSWRRCTRHPEKPSTCHSPSTWLAKPPELGAGREKRAEASRDRPVRSYWNGAMCALTVLLNCCAMATRPTQAPQNLGPYPNGDQQCVWRLRNPKPPNDNGRDTLSLIRPTVHRLKCPTKSRSNSTTPHLATRQTSLYIQVEPPSRSISHGQTHNATAMPKHTADLGLSGSCPRTADVPLQWSPIVHGFMLDDPKVCQTLSNHRSLAGPTPKCRTLADAIFAVPNFGFPFVHLDLGVMKQFVLDNRVPISNVVKLVGRRCTRHPLQSFSHRNAEGDPWNTNANGNTSTPLATGVPRTSLSLKWGRTFPPN